MATIRGELSIEFTPDGKHESPGLRVSLAGVNCPDDPAAVPDYVAKQVASVLGQLAGRAYKAAEAEHQAHEKTKARLATAQERLGKLNAVVEEVKEQEPERPFEPKPPRRKTKKS